MIMYKPETRFSWCPSTLVNLNTSFMMLISSRSMSSEQCCYLTSDYPFPQALHDHHTSADTKRRRRKRKGKFQRKLNYGEILQKEYHSQVSCVSTFILSILKHSRYCWPIYSNDAKHQPIAKYIVVL